jgi:hypothetical protein
MLRIYTLLFVLVSFTSISQGIQQEFGKNRVQFSKKFAEWSQYDSENFTTYWYGDARNIGQSSAQIAESEYPSIQNLFEYKVNNKIELIIFTDLTDLKQSNIGLEDAFTNYGEQVKVYENKIFLYFDGNHAHLRTNIRKGIAAFLLDQILFGSNLQEIVQNAVLLNLPEWYKEGLISYTGEEWNTDLDNQLRNVIVSDRYTSFNKLALDKPVLAGHAMWHFITNNYGKFTLSNLLYLTRINRSLESGFIYVLGNTFEASTLACMEFYRKKYESEASSLESIQKFDFLKYKNKRKTPITSMKLNPSASQIAYVMNENGRVKVHVMDTKTKKTKVIFKYGSRNKIQATDYNYPLIDWKDNKTLGIIYEKRDVVYLNEINTEDNRTELAPFGIDFQRIYAFDYVNHYKIVVSAAQKGLTDLFYYNTKNRQSQRITNDMYDDFEPQYGFLNGKTGILFTSNRPDNSLDHPERDSLTPLSKTDIFFLPIDDTSKLLVRITNTADDNEWSPQFADSTHFTFKSEKSGIENLQKGYLDTIFQYNNKVYYLKKPIEVVEMHQDSVFANLDSTRIDSIIIKPIFQTFAFNANQSNYSNNLEHYAISNQKIAELFIQKDNPKFRIRDWNKSDSMDAFKTKFIETKFRKAGSYPIDFPSNNIKIVKNDSIEITTIKDTNKIEIDNYQFQSEFEENNEKVDVEIVDKTNTIGNEEVIKYDNPSTKSPVFHPFRQTRIIPYRLKFRMTDAVTRFDNNLLFGGLDNYAATPQGFSTPPLGFLLKTEFKDLFEDYHLQLGMRIQTNFSAAEYFIVFDNNKYKLDQRFALYRKSIKFDGPNTSNYNAVKNRSNTILGQYQLKYPFDVFTSLRSINTFRYDKYTTLGTDKPTLEQPTIEEQRLGTRLEYVFDNTLDQGLNIKDGTRYKIYAEVVKKMEISLSDPFKFEMKKGYLGVIGFDARHYLRLDRKSILAIRGAGATTFGSEKILYFLGGVDNGFFSNFNDNIPVAPGNYAFQTLSSNMRGFDLNIRNGSSFALINSEIRIPFFQYLYRKPITSSFFKNFQLIGFFDIGTAWQGSSPFNNDSPQNQVVLPKPPATSAVTLTVNYYRDPIVYGFGAGARVYMLGYFFRFDYGWGVETKVIQKPILHFSMGYDF